MNRFAGQLLASLGLGAGAAYGTDLLMHDQMDRLAQGARDWKGQVSSSGEEVAAAYSALFGGGPMSGMDRITVARALEGQLPPPGPDGKIQIKVSTPAAVEAIKGAIALTQQRPDLVPQVSQLLRSEMDLMAREQAAGQTTASVLAAMEAGAGVSPLVPAMAGLAGGAAGAAIPAGIAALRRGGKG